MLGLAAARSSRRYTPAITKWATCRGGRPKFNLLPFRVYSNEVTNEDATTQSSSSSEVLSTPNSLVESTDEAEPELPPPSPPELLGLKYDPSTLPLQRELTARDKVSEEEYAMTLVHGRSVFAPHLHPRTHGIPVANVHFRSHHTPLLKLFTHFALHAATSLGIPASNVIPLPTQRSLWTVIRSPFAHKKSQENFERKVHKRAIKAWDADPEVVQRWISYLRENAMPGVGMKITMWDRVPLGIGTVDLGDLDTIENLMAEAPSSIEALGQQIVAQELEEASK